MRRAGRKWRNALPLIGFFCVALTLAMATYTYRYERDYYQAEYALFALPPQVKVDENALNAAHMLAKDANELLQTPAFQQKVLQAAYSDGQTYVSAVGEDGAHIIRVVAQGPDAATVAGLANGAGRELVAQAASMLSATDAREMNPASVPAAPSGPNRLYQTLLTFFGSFAALSLLGLLFGSARESVGWRRRKAPGAALPCLGAAEKLPSGLRRYGKVSGAETFYDWVGESARESVRTVALSLRAMQEHAGYSVVIAGMGREEDGAPFSLLLASELAAEGFDVLLMELDAYAPALRDYLGVRGAADVLHCMESEAALRAAILPTAVSRLCFMDVCHGPGFVPAMAATAAFASFLSDAAHSFDYVFLSAPPVDCANDAAMLGTVADMTVLLAKDGKRSVEEIDGEAARLSRVVRRLGGYALTQTPGRRLRVPRGARTQASLKA